MEKCIHGCNKTGCSGIIYMKRGESMQKNAPSGKLTTAERDASLDRCLSGIADEDPAALEELYRLTSAPVYGYALSFLKNAQDAEDVLHDCFVNVYVSAKGYDSLSLIHI